MDFRLRFDFCERQHILENFQILLQGANIDYLTVCFRIWLGLIWLCDTSVCLVFDHRNRRRRGERCVVNHVVHRLNILVNRLDILTIELGLAANFLFLLPAEVTLNAARCDVGLVIIIIVSVKVDMEVQRSIMRHLLVRWFADIVVKRTNVELALPFIVCRHLVETHQRLAEAVLFPLLCHADLIEHAPPLVVGAWHGTLTTLSRIGLTGLTRDCPRRLARVTFGILSRPKVLLAG